MAKCKICEAESSDFATDKILKKYDVNYFQCLNCGFVQTEEPYWLEEAYSEAIASSDVGLVFRNIKLSEVSRNLILHLFESEGKFLDYGGGYGLFVRLMRDSGFDFYWYDKFCQNIYSKNFEALENPENPAYEVVTAFEVFEHFVNPIAEIEEILKYSKNILFSTELLPESNPKPSQWWYYALEEGQHISLYTKKALSILAKKFDLNLYSNNSSLHLLTQKKLPPALFESLCRSEPKVLKKSSLLHRDYLQAIGKLGEVDNNFNQKATNEQSEEVQYTSVTQKIAVDGVFFQLYKTGIARLWKTLLQEWVKSNFAKNIIVFDRAGTAPKIPGINYHLLPAYDYNNTEADREILQQACDEENAGLFISTYYTTPISTPSVFMAYDMIPEVLQWDLQHPMWQEKHYAIKYASAYIAISENTACDLVKFFPNISSSSVKVALCGVQNTFFPASLEEVNNFKTNYGISKPYFILVGTGGYKNTILFVQAFAQLCSKQGFEIVCTGSGVLWPVEFRADTSGSIVHMLRLSDEELRAAYSGAVALVYPSKYEGFGLPILEAMACGCPVITCPNASIPEAAGEGALYVNDTDINGMVNALCEIQKPDVRNSLIATGLEQSKKFSWSNMAKIVSSALLEANLVSLNLKDINLIIFPNWNQPEESLGIELAQVIRELLSNPAKNYITLLIDTTGISEEDANLFLSSVAMNLLMEEDLDISEELEISLIGKLEEIQWEALLPRLQARIILENENQEAIAQAKAETLLSFELDSFNEQETAQFFFI